MFGKSHRELCWHLEWICTFFHSDPVGLTWTFFFFKQLLAPPKCRNCCWNCCSESKKSSSCFQSILFLSSGAIPVLTGGYKGTFLTFPVAVWHHFRVHSTLCREKFYGKNPWLWGSPQSLSLAAFRHILSTKLQRQQWDGGTFLLSSWNREQPSPFPNTSVNAAQQIFVKCLGFSRGNRKGFLTENLER